MEEKRKEEEEEAVPVGVLDDAPVDPLLQDLEVGQAGGLGEVEAQLLGLRVARVVEGPLVQEAQRGAAHALAFVHRRRCGGGGGVIFIKQGERSQEVVVFWKEEEIKTGFMHVLMGLLDFKLTCVCVCMYIYKYIYIHTHTQVFCVNLYIYTHKTLYVVLHTT